MIWKVLILLIFPHLILAQDVIVRNQEINFGSITNIGGNTIQSFIPFQSDISLDLPSSIYVITLSVNNGIFTSHRIVVEH